MTFPGATQPGETVSAGYPPPQPQSRYLSSYAQPYPRPYVNPYAQPYANPYPYPYVPGPGMPAPRTNAMAVWAFVLVIVLGALGALVGIPLAFVARSTIKKSNGAQKGAGLALAALIVGFAYFVFLAAIIAIGVVGAPDNGPSELGLASSVQSQLTSTGTNGFDVSGVVDVQCNPPSTWTSGATFTCFVYGTDRQQIGQYHGTVDADGSNGDYQWHGTWDPSGMPA